MARIVMVDEGPGAFAPVTLDSDIVDGIALNFLELANALAARGHSVTCHVNYPMRPGSGPVGWYGMGQNLPDQCDLYLVNRSPAALSDMPENARPVLWLHDARDWRWAPLTQWILWNWPPILVFRSTAHLKNFSSWGFDRGKVVIPPGLPPLFRNARRLGRVPPLRALYLAHPPRSLEWLLDLWASQIQPQVPTAELHIVSPPTDAGDNKLPDRAFEMGDLGVVVRPPMTDSQLAVELRQARCLLMPGDSREIFGDHLTRAQAMGLPAVVEDVIALREWVSHGETGFIVRGGKAFADAALRLLTDDALWLRQHRAALRLQSRWGWKQAALAFEGLLDW